MKSKYTLTFCANKYQWIPPFLPNTLFWNTKAVNRDDTFHFLWIRPTEMVLQWISLSGIKDGLSLLLEQYSVEFYSNPMKY